MGESIEQTKTSQSVTSAKLNLATQVVFTVWSQVSVEDTNTIVISGLVLSPISAAVLRVKWSCK